MQDLIRRSLVFVDSEQTMGEVVSVMCEQNVSSVLVLNSDRMVLGILTERDVVQKFTLLENPGKLQSSVKGFMTHPVLFAKLENLEVDVREMFFQKHLRHFPVCDGSSYEKDVLGMLTVTDVSRSYFLSPNNLKNDLKKELLVVVSRDLPTRNRYKTLFEALNYTVLTGSNIDSLVEESITHGYPVVFDVDGLAYEEARKDLIKLRSHRGIFIILGSQLTLVEPLKKLLNNKLHCVAMKPLDISYILLLLSRLSTKVPA